MLPTPSLTRLLPLKILAILALAFLFSAQASAQTVEAVGVRALGLGGAFVGVADDAAAVYWNPAGLATGQMFSLVIERTRLENIPEAPALGAFEDSGTLFAIGAPPAGLTYYRLRFSDIRPVPASEGEPESGREDTAAAFVGRSLVTHNYGITVVQSLLDGVTVATTTRFVRGIAAQGPISGEFDRNEALSSVTEIVGRADNTFDIDLGVMVDLGSARIGMVARNMREAKFEVQDGERFELTRQVRVGMALIPSPRFTAAVDMDLTRTPTVVGDQRHLAFGAEHWWGQRQVGIRGGMRVNTIDDARPAYSAGVSVAARSSFWIDAYGTTGKRDADRGWGIGTRVGF